MKIAIMQPYIFPYIGYFQLINTVDKFIIYDDVNFIKQGWINRNKILVQGNENYFTIPLEATSSFKKINDTIINENKFPFWKKKFLRTIQQSYTKAPYYKDAKKIIDNVLDFNSQDNISTIATKSILEICNYLKIKTEIVTSSTKYNNSHLNSDKRVIDICKMENANTYINPIGGVQLYNKEKFKEHKINLQFIKSELDKYKQFNNEFIPWLSMIDVLMFNSWEEIHKMINKNYQIS